MTEPASPPNVRVTIEAPEGTRVRLSIAAAPRPARLDASLSQPAGLPAAVRAHPLARLAPALRAWNRAQARLRAADLAAWLFAGALAVYTLTRLIGLTDFPIYFFSDEAIQTVLAANFVRDGFRNYLGEFFPTYFQNGPFWNLSVSVYAQVLPYLLFGKTIFVTRAASVVITITGAAATGLILKRHFRAPYWWSGVLLLSVAPAWFLHSRTAFETAEMVALYACFLHFYLKYRLESPRHLFAALIFGALSFYAYSPGQMVMVVSGLLLIISDFRYHLRNWRIGLAGVALLGVLALPLVRFQLAHPDASYSQLRERGSYLVDPRVPVSEKVWQTAVEYAYGLSPGYWYFPNHRDIARHIMQGYGNLPTWTLPFAVLGLGLMLKNFRSPAHRVVLIALLATPAGGALAEIGITRVLMFVIPATLAAALGLMWALQWVERRGAPRALLAVGLFVVLSAANLLLLRDGLVNGPTWFHDYGLGGMQYGMKQLFVDRLPVYLARDPQVTIYLSPSWTNGADAFPQFFFTPEQQARLEIASLDHFTAEPRDLDQNLLVVLPADEYQRALTEPKLAPPVVEEILPYPDGQPGFYFVRLAYSAEAPDLFEAERLARLQLVIQTVMLDGQSVTITYSQLGGGSLNDILDGDPFTLGRGLEANPLIFDFQFSAARTLTGVTLTTGTLANFTVNLQVFAVDAADPHVISQTYRNLPSDPTVTIDFEAGSLMVSRLVVEVMDNLAGADAQIHIREIAFR